MSEQYLVIRNNISMLDKLLNDKIKDEIGKNILRMVETICKLSKSSWLLIIADLTITCYFVNLFQ